MTSVRDVFITSGNPTLPTDKDVHGPQKGSILPDNEF